ncbi:hypothetical protein GA0115239_101345 [Streptomyces sp. BpilaLS-43]|nr:hypothetical protein GA0115239_101345 [Streptomyces sp. BpilaLS-43]
MRRVSAAAAHTAAKAAVRVAAAYSSPVPGRPASRSRWVSSVAVENVV